MQPTSAISCKGSRKVSSWLPRLARPSRDSCSIFFARSCTVPCLKGVFKAVFGTCTAHDSRVICAPWHLHSHTCSVLKGLLEADLDTNARCNCHCVGNMAICLHRYATLRERQKEHLQYRPQLCMLQSKTQSSGRYMCHSQTQATSMIM